MRRDVLVSKIASFAIVWCMVVSVFAGLLVVGAPSVGQALLPSYLSNGDTVIGADYEVSNLNVVGAAHYVDGNLTIRAGGTVTVTDGALVFRQTIGMDARADTPDDQVYTLTI